MGKKFDVVLMNPPYKKRLWMQFITTMLDLNPDLLLTINPDPTDNQSSFGQKWREICIANGISKRDNVTKYFPNVKSGKISFFILNRTQKPDLKLLKPDNQTYVNILNKITDKDSDCFVIRGQQHVSGYGNKKKALSVTENKTTTHIHPCIMSCTNKKLVIKYSNELIASKKIQYSTQRVLRNCKQIFWKK